MKRLDVILAEKGLYASREKAKQAVESGRVKVNDVLAKKAAALVEEDADFECLPFEFVSRGGFKLQKALEVFEIDLKGKVVLDIGASTGGFTDVCLQNAAKKVYAVDTGEGQLAEKLKNNPRVVNLEKTNYLTLPKECFADVNFVCIDVSFVSLTKLAPKLAADFGDSPAQTACQHSRYVEDVLCGQAKIGKNMVDIVALIKPQFECGVEYARKHKGIVKDEKIHKKIVENVIGCFENFGFKKGGLATSPIKGGDGNTEFLLWLKNNG